MICGRHMWLMGGGATGVGCPSRAYRRRGPSMVRGPLDWGSSTKLALYAPLSMFVHQFESHFIYKKSESNEFLEQVHTAALLAKA